MGERAFFPGLYYGCHLHILFFKLYHPGCLPTLSSLTFQKLLLDSNNNWLKLTPAHLAQYTARNRGFIFDERLTF